MGAYLQIGLRTRLSIAKDSESSKNDELKKLLGSQIDLSIYDEQETSNRLLWTLKPSLIEQELVPFLQKQFDLIPNANEVADRNEMLTELQAVQTVQALKDWYDSSELYVGGWNPYDSLTIRAGKGYQHLAVETFVFLSEGKISMEQDGGIFGYFETLMVLSNPEFEIAKAASVSIN